MTKNTKSLWITATEAIDISGVSRGTFYKFLNKCNSGETCVRPPLSRQTVGNRKFYDRKDVHRWKKDLEDNGYIFEV